MPVKQKAFAYITHRSRLLIFRHVDYPQAGLQVPAGSIEPDELPADAVLREAREESGLTNLRLGAFLGETEFDMSAVGRNSIHHRYFYHVICEEESPARWEYSESDP